MCNDDNECQLGGWRTLAIPRKNKLSNLHLSHSSRLHSTSRYVKGFPIAVLKMLFVNKMGGSFQRNISGYSFAQFDIKLNFDSTTKLK